MAKKSILIIGAGVMQLPLIKQSKENNYTTIVMDGNPEAPGVEISDLWINCSIDNEEKSLLKAKQLNESNSINAVLTVGTDYIRVVSKIGEALGLPSIPYQQALILTNKYMMRKRLLSCGLMQPEFYHLQKKSDVALAVKYFLNKGIYQVVIKPTDSMGSRGVMFLDINKVDESSLFLAYEKAQENSRNGNLLLEEYIAGEEYSIDAIIYDGKVQITGVADRIIEHHPFFVETGHIIPSQRDEVSIANVKENFIKAIHAMGITHGAAKGDILVKKDGKVIVGEIAGRLSGGFMSMHTYPLSSGVNLMDIILKISLGDEPPTIFEKKLGVVIEKAIILPPGKIFLIEGIKKLKNITGVELFFLKVKIGDTISSPENNLMKSGNIIVRAENKITAENILKEALETLNIKTKP